MIDIDSIDVEEAWSCVLLAWEGLALKINEDGTIRDIIGGTGIQVILFVIKDVEGETDLTIANQRL